MTGRIASIFLECSKCRRRVVLKFILSDRHYQIVRALAALMRPGGREIAKRIEVVCTTRNRRLRHKFSLCNDAYLLVRFELFFNFVLPNFVCAKVAVVKSTGSCCRPRNVAELLAPDGLLFLYIGLVDDVGEESLGELFGLNVKPFKDELRISMGRKHWASGLKVVVTSRSALLSSGESCFCSE